MFFEKLEHTWIKEIEDLYSRCRECERSARTNPNNSVDCAKSAVELMSTNILLKNGIEIPKNKLERKLAELETSFDRINTGVKLGLLSEDQQKLSDDPRIKGNKNGHVTPDGNIDKKANVKIAVEAFYNLYKFIASCTDPSQQSAVDINKNEKNKNRKMRQLENRLPIGDYDVINLMYDEKSPNKIPTYKCRSHKNQEEYAIIRRYDRNNKDDARQIRDILAANELKTKIRNLNRPVIIAQEITIADSCDYRYLAYITNENTFLMSSVSQMSVISPENKLKIFEQVVSILNSLLRLGKGVSLHHRALKPACVFITLNDLDEYVVEIGNFECSKIINSADFTQSEFTVINPDFINRSRGDVYMPLEMKNGSIINIPTPDWEQIDVYSCAVLLFYLVCGSNPSTSKFEDYLDDIYDLYSPELADITEKIIKSPYGSRPTLKEYLDVISEALKNIS